MKPEETLDAVVGRVAISTVNTDSGMAVRDTVDVSQEEYDLLYIGDQTVIRHPELGPIIAVVDGKIDERRWYGWLGCQKKFQIKLSLMPFIE